MRHDKETAKAIGVPKWLRRYSWRYGKGIYHLLQTHKQQDAAEKKILADEAAEIAKIGVPALPERTVIEGIVNA